MGCIRSLWVSTQRCCPDHTGADRSDQEINRAILLYLALRNFFPRLVRSVQSTAVILTETAGLLAAHQAGKIASVISVESGHSIGTSLAVLRMYYRLGARSLTLTHNCNNPWADSSLVDKEGNQPVHNGLTSFGKVSSFFSL